MGVVAPGEKKIHLMLFPVAARSKALGLWPLACWDCGFESHRGHGCLFASVVCQVEVSASG